MRIILGLIDCYSYAIFRLTYLSAVLNEFPSLVSNTVHLTAFLKLSVNVLNSNYVGREEIYNFMLSVLLVEKYHMNKGLIKNHSTLWENVWDILIR